MLGRQPGGSPGALGSAPCCLCPRLFGGHPEKLWLVRVWVWSVQGVGVNVEDAGKFCEVCASLRCCGCSDHRAGSVCVCFGMRQVSSLCFLVV